MSGGTGTVLGGFAHAISSNQKKAEFSFGGALIGGLLGAGLGFVLKRNAQNEIETINERTIPSIKKRIGYLTIQLKQANSFLLKIPQLIANPDYKDPINKKPISTPLPEADIIQNDVGQEELSTKGKIICSNDLKGMKFRSLDFKDDWQSLLGKPSVDFKMAVFGKPGQGKSTFCLQFANYLAQNFGRVLYVSGEEGFSKTMKDKLQDNRAFDKNLFIADICSAEDMIENIPQNAYHFIIVDSLNNMGIDENSLLELEEHYNNCAMISIAQSTKKGEMRGSQEILHNVDIVLKVEDGFAECTKNRFAPLGFEFSIF
ncbi:MAG: AAA family ATPase [Crocinitomicaceae bacterium]|nr:AAA family ATPase [Crocinitomicaceae bacterium]